MNEKGITLIALIVTIIVTIIIAGISIVGAKNNMGETKEDVATSELKIVANAVVQTKTKFDIAKSDYNGNVINAEKYNELKNVLEKEGMRLLSEDANDYFLLTPEDGLKKIGITNTEDTYIVSFKTGEVFNYTKQKTSGGTVLYINAFGES